MQDVAGTFVGREYGYQSEERACLHVDQLVESQDGAKQSASSREQRSSAKI